MNKSRLEAFTDGVIAIIITIAVLEIKVKAEATLDEILNILPLLLSYALSFSYISSYWISHHNMIHKITKVNGRILTANLHWLFWLSLIPVTTNWIWESNFNSVSVALYGFILTMSAISYNVIALMTSSEGIINAAYVKKAIYTILIYTCSIPIAFIEPILPLLIYAIILIIWSVPFLKIKIIFNSKWICNLIGLSLTFIFLTQNNYVLRRTK